MGRSETIAVKTHMIKLRVAESDLEMWREAARNDKLSLSDWIRRRCEGRPTTVPKPMKGSKR